MVTTSSKLAGDRPVEKNNYFCASGRTISEINGSETDFRAPPTAIQNEKSKQSNRSAVDSEGDVGDSATYLPTCESLPCRAIISAELHCFLFLYSPLPGRRLFPSMKLSTFFGEGVAAAAPSSYTACKNSPAKKLPS